MTSTLLRTVGDVAENPKVTFSSYTGDRTTKSGYHRPTTVNIRIMFGEQRTGPFTVFLVERFPCSPHKCFSMLWYHWLTPSFTLTELEHAANVRLLETQKLSEYSPALRSARFMCCNTQSTQLILESKSVIQDEYMNLEALVEIQKLNSSIHHKSIISGDPFQFM